MTLRSVMTDGTAVFNSRSILEQGHKHVCDSLASGGTSARSFCTRCSRSAEARLQVLGVQRSGLQLLDLALQLRDARGVGVLQAGFPPPGTCCLQSQLPKLLLNAPLIAEGIRSLPHKTCQEGGQGYKLWTAHALAVYPLWAVVDQGSEHLFDARKLGLSPLGGAQAPSRRRAASPEPARPHCAPAAASARPCAPAADLSRPWTAPVARNTCQLADIADHDLLLCKRILGQT